MGTRENSVEQWPSDAHSLLYSYGVTGLGLGCTNWQGQDWNPGVVAKVLAGDTR